MVGGRIGGTNKFYHQPQDATMHEWERELLDIHRDLGECPELDAAFRYIARSHHREIAALFNRLGRELPEQLDAIGIEIIADAINQSARDTDPDRLITAKDAADLLAITTKHLRTLTDSGVIPCVRIGSTGIRYVAADLRAFMREGGIR